MSELTEVPQVKEMTISWGDDCSNCGHSEAVIYSTATKESGYEFMDGDKVKCTNCGHNGEMFAEGEMSDIAWAISEGDLNA